MEAVPIISSHVSSTSITVTVSVAVTVLGAWHVNTWEHVSHVRGTRAVGPCAPQVTSRGLGPLSTLKAGLLG